MNTNEANNAALAKIAKLDPTETSTIMYFDMPAWGLQMSEKLAADHGRKVEYPISGDALARIRAKA